MLLSYSAEKTFLIVHFQYKQSYCKESFLIFQLALIQINSSQFSNCYHMNDEVNQLSRLSNHYSAA